MSVVAAVEDREHREQIKQLVGRNIVRGQREAGISNQGLADLVGVDRRDVKRWRKGEVEPVYKIQAIARELNRPIWWFYAPHDEDDLR